MFHGSMVALVTPMLQGGSIDEESLRALIEFHIREGTQGIIAAGTTGEGATLTEEEHLTVIRIIIEQVAGRIPVIAGTGTSCTKKTLDLTELAMEAGADACLVVTPYYNKPTQEGLYQHFNLLATQVPIPIILYNVPGRTSVDILPETVARLAEIPNVIGIKEATGKVERGKQIMELCGEHIDVYSGDDMATLDLMLAGAKGVISVTANVAPRLMYEMCEAALIGESAKAIEINDRLKLLHQSLFIESNPIPVKWAMYRMGLIPPGIRLPLTPLATSYYEIVEKALQQAGVSLLN